MRYRINTPQITHETLDGEVIMVDFESGAYFSLHGSGEFIWSLVDNTVAVDDIASLVMQRYQGSPEEIHESVNSFLAELEKERLIVESGSEGLPESDVEQTMGYDIKEHFVPPVLEKHTDMQELLLLDPIHEVQDEGWPRRKPEQN